MSDSTNAVTVLDRPGTPTDLDDGTLKFVMNVQEAQARIRQLQEFVRSVMVEGVDFGTIPGTPKPTLLKPGAEKLCEIYGLAARFSVVNRVEDWERPFFHYEVHCRLESKRSGIIVAEGLGSCNSHESRYRYRKGERVCPECGQSTIIKGKAEYGGGFVCFAKKGGCGAKFPENDARITGQEVGRVANPDVADVVNTILKMAKKRAHVDAALSATRSSGIFTQDIEDWTPEGDARIRSQETEPVQRNQTQQSAPASSGRSHGLATQQQVRAIYGLGRDRHKLTEQEIDQRSVELFGADPSELTTKQASDFIATLKTSGTDKEPSTNGHGHGKTEAVAQAVATTERQAYLDKYAKLTPKATRYDWPLPEVGDGWNNKQLGYAVRKATAVVDYCEVEIEARLLGRDTERPDKGANAEEIEAATAALRAWIEKENARVEVTA